MRLHSTRNPSWHCNLRQALGLNMAPDGGLLVPELPNWQDWDALLQVPWPDRGAEMLVRLAAGEFDRAELQPIAREALAIAVPLLPVEADTYVLELWHGPTLAFKDFGARLLARLLALVDGPNAGNRTILTATSGDTGAAVAAAFHGVPGGTAVVLYPAGRVSGLQEQQIAGWGGNVLALRVAGSFDDCQAMVKGAFADRKLATALRLTSANSIHIGRLLAQLTYFSELAAQFRAMSLGGPPPVVAVPCGNFGHLTAALYAKQLGMPLGPLVVAPNANRTVPDFLDGGSYQVRRSVATPSNAMDVGAPSNWERVAHFFGNDAVAMRTELRWGSATDDQTRAEMVRLHRLGYPADPHGAVASHVLRQVRRRGEAGVFLATAHPGKFGDIVQQATGVAPLLPQSLRATSEKPLQFEALPADLPALRARLQQWAAR